MFWTPMNNKTLVLPIKIHVFLLSWHGHTERAQLHYGFLQIIKHFIIPAYLGSYLYNMGVPFLEANLLIKIGDT